jgi:hypothetical protein
MCWCGKPAVLYVVDAWYCEEHIPDEAAESELAFGFTDEDRRLFPASREKMLAEDRPPTCRACGRELDWIIVKRGVRAGELYRWDRLAGWVYLYSWDEEYGKNYRDYSKRDEKLGWTKIPYKTIEGLHGERRDCRYCYYCGEEVDS